MGSTIPNLALMQLSAWLKSKGESVSLVLSDGETVPEINIEPDAAWISCVFTWHRYTALGLAARFEAAGADVHIGGTGVDLCTQLPVEAQDFKPDYTLYEDDRALGFSVRGCNRKCSFCVVPSKEGKIDIATYRPLHSWVPADRKKVLLLDNNIAQSPFHDDVLKETKELGLKLSITQGYDIRLMTPERASMLADWKPWDLKFHERRLYIAWDYLGIEGSVRRGIQMLLDAGFKGRDIMCYMLCGFTSSHEEDLYRFRTVRSYGAMPYVMRYNNRHDDRWLNAFSRWVNRLLYKACEWENYRRNPDLVGIRCRKF